MTHNLSIILLIFYIQGVALSIFLLLVKRKKKRPLYFLSFFTFSFSIAVIGKILFFLSIITLNNLFYYLSTSLLFAMGPSFFFYIKLQMMPYPKFQGKSIFHFLPLFIECVYYLVIPTDIIMENYNRIYNMEQMWAQFSIIIYIFFAYRLIKRSPNTKNVKWFKNLIFISLLGVIIWAFYVLYSVFILNNDIIISDYFFLYFYAAFVVYSISYRAYLKPLLNIEVVGETKDLPENYQELANKILEYMESKKPYKNADLRIKDFSHSIALPVNRVSEIINQVFHKSFSDLISEYRVNEVKSKLLSSDMERYSIETIALKNGFRSRSSFFRIFKDVTGYTATEYLAKHKKSPK